MILKPKKLRILGKPYTITYVDNPADVDSKKRESLWGQVDYWTRTIRIYDNENPIEDIWHTLIHEIIHAIASDLNIKVLEEEENHDDLDILALALSDVFLHNDLIKLEE